MKRILCVISLISTLAANASMLEIVSNISDQADVAGITMNKDGSVSIRDISVKRGDLSYPIAISEVEPNYTSTCKLLGFDSSLSGAGLNAYSSVSGHKVFLYSDGTYNTIKNHGYKIDKVTCFKSGQLKTIAFFDKVENADKSSRITNISYHRGDLSYPIAISEVEPNYTSTCKLLGFDSNLTGAGLNAYSSISGHKVFLYSDGTYNMIKNHGYKIDKVTCFSGTEPSLIVLVSGRRYMRVIP